MNRLKKILPLLLLALLVLNSSAQEIKVLTIGNSFANDLVAYLPQIAESSGKKLLLGRTNLGGCTLERHATHLAAALENPDAPKARSYANNPIYKLPDQKTVSLPEALASQPWDIVTIQQASPLSFKPETYEPHATQIIAAVRKFAPTATILVHQTWAWREDHLLFTDGFTQQKMLDGLVAAYRELAQRHGLRTIPSGTAIQNARKTPRWTYRTDPAYDFKNPTPNKLPEQSASLQIGWKWTTKNGKPELVADTIHLNDAGRYLVACLFFEMLYDASCLDLKFSPETLSATDAQQLRQIAHDTPREKISLPQKK